MGITHETIYLLGISGSLRQHSSNTMLLRAAQQLTPKGVELLLYPDLAALPHFNPDVEESTLPLSVSNLRHQIRKADGLIISTPEYAHGIPGSLKNALDWLVGGSEFVGKPVMLLNASSRSVYAQTSLIETLKTMSGHVVEEACVSVELMGKHLDETGIIENPVMTKVIQKGLEVFAAKMNHRRQQPRAARL